MAKLFRQSAIDKFASPEQLNRSIRLVPRMEWLAVGGAVAMAVVALIWSVWGRLPEKVTANGIYTSTGGVYTVSSQVTGIVTKVDVASGDTVADGQLIITVADTANSDAIDKLAKRIQNVQAITFDSEYDDVTADTKDLVDVKTQVASLAAQLTQEKNTLSLRVQEYNTQKTATDAAQAALTQKQQAYYDLAGVASDPAVQNNFQVAQSAYLSAQNTYSSVELQYSSTANTYKMNMQYALQGIYAAGGAPWYTDAAGEGYSLSATQPVGYALPSDDIILNTDPATMAEVTQGVTVYYLKKQADGSFVSESSKQIALTDAATLQALVSAWQSLSSARVQLNGAKSDMDTAKAAYDSAKAAYEALANKQQSGNVDKEKAQVEFNTALSTYNTAQQTLTSLQQAVETQQNNVNNIQLNLNNQKNIYAVQFDTAKQAILSSLNTQLEEYTASLEKSQITSTRTGTVSEVLVSEGSLIQAGSSLIKVKNDSGEENDNLVLCYIQMTSGKKVTPGMKVMIYPTTVNKQEYGHMLATVESVDDTAASQESMLTMLGDASLVQGFTQSGPVLAVYCRPETDDTSANGYKWSNKKGASLVISEGTLVSADIVTEEKAPISLLIPYLKNKLTITQKTSE